MNKLQLLRHSYSSRLQAYWNSLSIKRQRVLLFAVFTLYSLVCLFIVKTSFSSKLTSGSKEKQNNIRPVKYLLDGQKIESQSPFKIKSYESQSNR
ncbi:MULTISPECIES: hypothetical protein [Myroides]|uniref:hypothetical protein n=1 Tax=Myroides TaxID=76831 RepID=UPI000735DD6B|nr:hypothetical protein [Myroides odoratimimus]MDM1039719.1 hypothetical protein [Myroides odoratimimus]MDM1053966.1 hypothetical protein [Myroides odoratimimus]MDM1085277.1 hypothetical protein [Myroides odoratimimus]